MEYFWKQQDDIPEGMGYPLFGVAHLLSVGITLILVFLFVLWFRKMDDRKQRKVLKVIPIVMLMLEAFKDIFLVSVKRFGLTYLPLHICSIGIFVFLFREYLPWKKTKENEQKSKVSEIPHTNSAGSVGGGGSSGGTSSSYNPTSYLFLIKITLFLR